MGRDSLLSCQFREFGFGPESASVMADREKESDESFGGRAKESVTGWWGRSRRFLAEVRNEMGRVTWPSRKEVYATTVVVILTSILFGVYLWVIDLVLNGIMGRIFKAFGAA